MLDALRYERHDGTLAGYLSEANPHLFKGEGSADPAIWAEFPATFTKRFPGGETGLEDAHGFVTRISKA